MTVEMECGRRHQDNYVREYSSVPAYKGGISIPMFHYTESHATAVRLGILLAFIYKSTFHPFFPFPHLAVSTINRFSIPLRFETVETSAEGGIRPYFEKVAVLQNECHSVLRPSFRSLWTANEGNIGSRASDKDVQRPAKTTWFWVKRGTVVSWRFPAILMYKRKLSSSSSESTSQSFSFEVWVVYRAVLRTRTQWVYTILGVEGYG